MGVLKRSGGFPGHHVRTMVTRRPRGEAAEPVAAISFHASANSAASVRDLGMSVFQFVNAAFDGPAGVHAPTLITSLAVLAGYGTKKAVELDIANGTCVDDFRRYPIGSNRYLVLSDNVSNRLMDMNNSGVMPAILGAAMRAGLQRLPNVSVLASQILLDADAGVYSEYLCEKRIAPRMGPEAMAAMLWPDMKSFTGNDGTTGHLLPGAAAQAAAHAVSIYRNTICLETSIALAIRTALVMSKSDTTF